MDDWADPKRPYRRRRSLFRAEYNDETCGSDRGVLFRCVRVHLGGSTRRRHGREREAGLPTKYFWPCFSLRLLDLILRHHLMLDGHRRWKTELTSKPKRVHLGHLTSIRLNQLSPPVFMAASNLNR